MKFAMTAAALALAALTASAQAASAQTGPAGPDWRTPDPKNVIVVETNKGRIIAELYPDAAPNHVERVRGLVKSRLLRRPDLLPRHQRLHGPDGRSEEHRRGRFGPAEPDR
jgi:hypothetical protein